MNTTLTYIFLTLFMFSRCGSDKVKAVKVSEQNGVQSSTRTNQNDHTIGARIKVPENYHRSVVKKNSFQEYLRNLKLKPIGSTVTYYNGATKTNSDIYEAVVDMPIGTKDLHQCADAVMRLRAEYLWDKKRYDDISFNFTNGHAVAYKEWMAGKRMNVKGNKTWWSQRSKPSNTYDDFWNYMELIFMYAGTASLEKELKSVAIENAKIGDVLIQGGHPGHAIIIIDEAYHKQSGEPIYLLAQSYMPAQEIQILTNRHSLTLSPWYQLDTDVINTPEWSFNNTDLKRFEE